MSLVRFQCFCGRDLSADESQIGDQLSCPSCGQDLQVPGFRSTPTVVADSPPQKPAKTYRVERTSRKRRPGQRTISRRLLIVYGTMAAIVLSGMGVGAFFLFRPQPYTKTWYSDRGDKYIDTYSPDDVITHRIFMTSDRSWQATGPMTPSGKLHGQWFVVSESVDGQMETRFKWYWYGDEVSEGEWHLRANR